MSANNTTKLLLLFLTILSTFAILRVNNVLKCKVPPPLSPAEIQLASTEEPFAVSLPRFTKPQEGQTQNKWSNCLLTKNIQDSGRMRLKSGNTIVDETRTRNMPNKPFMLMEAKI